MSTHLEEEIESLKALIISNRQPDAIDTSSRYMKWIQSIIAIVIVIAVLGINWGISTSRISALEVRLTEVKESSHAIHTLKQHEIDKLKEEVMALKVSNGSKDTILVVIQKDVDEIKNDIKTLIKGK
jgi:hypothetical protein